MNVNEDADDKSNEPIEDDNAVVEECLRALIFSLIRLTGLLDASNFAMFKYFLTAILDVTRNLRSYLNYLI